ncbi:MAG: hypothetical protein AB7U83_04610 [Vicinamibacterales bacterium]
MAVVAIALLSMPAPVAGQVLGTFTWQLQPFCNRVVVTVIQTPGGFDLRGCDDLCGAPSARGLVDGMALMNPDGTVQMAFSLTSPGADRADVVATLWLGNLSGQWQDSFGHSGEFSFAPVNAGAPRPTRQPGRVLAYANVGVSPSSYAIVLSRGVSGVTKPTPGLYCFTLMLPEDTSVGDVYAQATITGDTSFAGNDVMVQTQQTSLGCESTQLVVRTVRTNGQPTDQTGFVVTVFRR